MYLRTFDDTIKEAWGLFLLELLALILVIVLSVFAFRYIRAICKRRRFVRKITALCKSNKILFNKNAWQYASIFRNTKKPDLIIDTESKRYVIKYFTPSIVKNINLHFITPNRYFITNVKGYILVTRNAGALIRAGFFKPKNIESTFLSLTHTEIVEFVKGEKKFPSIEFDKYKHESKKTQNVLIINPIPLNVKYINKNKFDLLLSGDSYHNYQMYSTEEFLLGFKRWHEKD